MYPALSRFASFSNQRTFPVNAFSSQTSLTQLHCAADYLDLDANANAKFGGSLGPRVGLVWRNGGGLHYCRDGENPFA